MPLELLQDSYSSSVTIGPHWPSSYPEYLSPHQDKDEQRRVVWARLLSQCSKLAGRLSEQNEQYQALRQELNPRTTQVGSSHDPLYRDNSLGFKRSFKATSINVYKPHSIRKQTLGLISCITTTFHSLQPISTQLCAFGVTPGHRLVIRNYNSSSEFLLS